MTLGAEAEAYLRKLRLSLSVLSPSERDDIITEIRGHISELLARGADVHDVLAKLGSAPSYARAFLEERELVSALASQRSQAMFGAVLRRATKNIVAFSAILLVGALGMLAFVAIGLACLELIDPQHTGLWISPREMFIGVIDDPASARELLGNWVFATAGSTVLFAWLLARSLLAWALRSIDRSRP